MGLRPETEAVSIERSEGRTASGVAGSLGLTQAPGGALGGRRGQPAPRPGSPRPLGSVLGRAPEADVPAQAHEGLRPPVVRRTPASRPQRACERLQGAWLASLDPEGVSPRFPRTGPQRGPGREVVEARVRGRSGWCVRTAASDGASHRRYDRLAGPRGACRVVRGRQEGA